MRMQIRRFARLTDAFSKKWENLKAAYALLVSFGNGVEWELRPVIVFKSEVRHHESRRH